MDEQIEQYAIVTMFGKTKRCKIQAHGDLQTSYERDDILWIERGEDWYAQSHYSEPYCVLLRADWLNGHGVDAIDNYIGDE